MNSNKGKINPLQYRHDIIGEAASVSFDFALKEECDDFEVRVYSNRQGLAVDSIEIIKY